MQVTYDRSAEIAMKPIGYWDLVIPAVFANGFTNTAG